MSEKIFDTVYSDAYDPLYADKDYNAECDLIEGIFARYGDGQIRRILDLGCGTGNHAILLAQRGYRVLGVDISEEMLKHAKAKVSAAGLSDGQVRFAHGDVRFFSIEEEFDAVLMMFAVLGYQVTNAHVLAALRAVQRSLKPGGLFVCDVWYGPAVLAQGPGERVKVAPTTDGKVIRVVRASLAASDHVARVHYHLWRLTGERLVGEVEETHTMRYFFPQELALFLDISGLKLLSLCSFDDRGKPAGEDTWNVLVTAQKTPQR